MAQFIPTRFVIALILLIAAIRADQPHNGRESYSKDIVIRKDCVTSSVYTSATEELPQKDWMKRCFGERPYLAKRPNAFKLKVQPVLSKGLSFVQTNKDLATIAKEVNEIVKDAYKSDCSHSVTTTKFHTIKHQFEEFADQLFRYKKQIEREITRTPEDRKEQVDKVDFYCQDMIENLWKIRANGDWKAQSIIGKTMTHMIYKATHPF